MVEVLEKKSQQGFEYEKNVTKILKPLGIVPRGFNPAGATAKPDVLLQHNNKKAGCELKLKPQSGGSLVLKFDVKNIKKPWSFGDIDRNDDEKIFVEGMVEKLRIMDLINKNWTGAIPMLRDRDELWEATAGKMTRQERYEHDRENFKEFTGEIAATQIEKYYNIKGEHYINIGTHGFYTLGNDNPLDLYDVPLFSKRAKANYRVRVKQTHNFYYRFIFEMAFYMPAAAKSPFNIGPTDGKNPRVIKNAMDLRCFI